VVVIDTDHSDAHERYRTAWDNALAPVIERPVSIIEFSESKRFCGLKLYPHQRIVLKIYNNEVLDEWEMAVLLSWIEEGYLPPDTLDRIARRGAFREFVAVIGRRGSKSLMSAIIALYEVYKLLLKDNPHDHYNMLAGDPIQVACVADSSNQADETIFAKIHALVRQNEWLLERIPGGRIGNDIYFATRNDMRIAERLWREQGIRDLKPSVQLRSYSANSGASRGRAVIVVVFDEIAHYQNREGRDNAYNLYEALAPATTDFGEDGRIASISSPKYEFGKFFDQYTDIWSGAKKNSIGFQIPSWEMYKNAERVGLRPRFTLHSLKYDNETIEFGTPQWWREYGAQFQKNVSLYMNGEHISRMFKRAKEMQWTWRDGGTQFHLYHGHGDPAKNRAGYPFMVAHYDARLDAVVVDWAWRWRVRQRLTDTPLDAREHLYKVGDIIDYDSVETTIEEKVIDRFHMRKITFDHWNSIGSIQRLKKYARNRGKNVFVEEVTFSRGFQEDIYEKLRTELANHRVVCPFWQILSLELNNVINNGGKIEPPSTGPVTTKDAADCLAVLVSRCLEDAEKGRTETTAGQTVQQMGGVPVSMPQPAIIQGRPFGG
jgi:hypothetical protein